MNVNFILLITYSFNTDYISVPCETEEEAFNWMDRLTKEEIGKVKREEGYTPQLLETDDDEKILVYHEAFDACDYLEDYYDYDYVTYRIIEINHGFKQREQKEDENNE